MHSSSIVLALPALAVAQDQIPLGDKLRGWFNKASAYIPSSIPSAFPDPLDAGAAKVAEKVVRPITLSNYKSVLTPSPAPAGAGPEEWMIYITGGNKTCYGLCGNATSAWNKAVPVLSALPKGPQLAQIDCEVEGPLCNGWAVGPPAIYHFLLPRPLADQTKPATTVRYIPLNRTDVTAKEITDLHTQSKYLETEPYEGYLHPFDGLVVKSGAVEPLGHFLYWIGKMPSWLPMIAISFLSRTFMGGRRAQPGGHRAEAPPAAPAAR